MNQYDKILIELAREDAWIASLNKSEPTKFTRNYLNIAYARRQALIQELRRVRNEVYQNGQDKSKAKRTA